ncbi:MAG: trypsin-like peptidase domain-containing protein [Spirochaetes bacterium]|nr:trypsin-like peptidase domain-containing protein [Spirochaetota bacterium]
MKRSRMPALFGLPAISIFLIVTLFCSSGDKGLLGASGESPLRNGDKVADAVKVQETFRTIYEINSHKVVYISTEQTVKLQQNPFFNDPFFRQFFGNPGQGRPRTQKRTGLGTGFVLSEDGYICTNHHVVAGVDKVKVKVDTITYDAVVVGSDERTDLALLKIKPKEKLEPVFLGDSNTVQVGDWAIAIGNPFGLDRTFTVGVVSAVGRRDLDLMGGSQTHIQTDASINPGNSGGPLLNVYGEVIGINRMIYSQTGGNIGIGFAIPINTAKAVLDQLKQHKKIKRGYIGVQIVPLTEEYAKELGLKSNDGALVGQVVDGSPAEKGGVQVGDVILRVNDIKLKDFGDLVEQVEKTVIGKTIKIVVWRNKSKVSLFITIGERP